ncbi:hypothetical protein [Microcoleus sp. S13C4]|uniref:hypothetical protein n=1 Tax=Microcoleus sp. S13C4 TaxID=3055410 RepID=UPI002FD13700
MTHFVSQRTRSIGAVAVGASLRASLRVICSGAIEQILNAYTTHSGEDPAKPCADLILPQTPVNTRHNRGFLGVSLVAQSTKSAQANRGFSAVGFEAAIGGAASW